MKCKECIIGMLLDYDNSKLITLNELKEHIDSQNSLIDNELHKWIFPKAKKISLSDYKDRRKNNDIYRFSFCPYCGEKIDWKNLG